MIFTCIIAKLKSNIANISNAKLDVKFAFPFLQVCLTHPEFENKEDYEREEVVAKILELSIAELRSSAQKALVNFHFFAPGEKVWIPERGDHWIFRESWPSVILPSEQDKPAVTHFFGYKGGQARSTVMAVLARHLAEKGLRVLMVDADLEAPSLTVIVGKQPRLSASTLLGLHAVQDAEPKPISCLVSNQKGAVDLLAARLPEADVELEYDAFTLKSLLDPSVPENLGRRILEYAKKANYDVVFVDQRTGSSPATLNWFDAIPGGVCIFARLDGQWQAGARFYRILIERTPSYGAAIVSFKPDEENPDTYRSRTADQIAGLSEILERSFLKKIPDQDENDLDDPAEGVADIDRWLMWPYDQSFRISRFPASQDLGHQTREAIQKLGELLELPEGTISSISNASGSSIYMPAHSSGALDSDMLIHTPVLRDLRAENSSICYVFGRKGTGKTRLFKAMAEEQRGIALVADIEFQGTDGLRSEDLKNVPSDQSFLPEALWWQLLLVASQGKTDRASLKAALNDASSVGADDLRKYVKQVNERKVFLIDGLETAFRVNDVQPYVNALLEVMRILQSDPDLREKVEVKLFLRTDLKEKANVQNLEQQLSGRERYLAWDLQAILNFILSRIASDAYSVFKQHFPERIEAIRGHKDDILEAGVKTDPAFDLLLPMFPERVKRVNAFMRTFLTLHFADSSSEGGRYYPRFVLDFLGFIDKAGQTGLSDSQFRGQLMEKKRLSSAVVQYAFDEASKKFLTAVRQELGFVVNLNPDELDRLLNAFSGKATPFDRSRLAHDLALLTGISIEKINDAINTFKSLGIFEDRPGYEGSEWRAGRIFRSALRMKLRR